MRDINLIVVHCSDSYDYMDVGVKDIRKWHIERGFADIGYHYVVRRDGSVEVGRDFEEVGAHAHGFNANSIGICWVGGLSDRNTPEDNRTPEQINSLHKMIESLKEIYPDSKVLGHCDLKGVTKTCPNFDTSELEIY